MNNRRWRCLVVAAIVMLVPTFAHADVIWPALFLEPRLLSVPIVVVGLLIEAAVLRLGFRMRWLKAIFASAVANAISAALGAVLIPVAGIAWEIFPGILLYKVLNMGTFNPFTWAATFSLATAVTTAIEVGSLHAIFNVPLMPRTWGLWFFANAASVSLAFASFAIQPDR
ncbi:MAG: hypothetical protein JO303_18750 [Caulobacteraceae bacterium]|nr:hypothetical protein [Caulobacteraceae bacterium]